MMIPQALIQKKFFLPFLFLLLIVSSSTASAFCNPSPSSSIVLKARSIKTSRHFNTELFAGGGGQQQNDSSRSGFRRERLDKLAELEDSRVETDKGFVVYAAGAFAVLILLGVVAAFVLQV